MEKHITEAIVRQAFDRLPLRGGADYWRFSEPVRDAIRAALEAQGQVHAHEMEEERLRLIDAVAQLDEVQIRAWPRLATDGERLAMLRRIGALVEHG